MIIKDFIGRMFDPWSFLVEATATFLTPNCLFQAGKWRMWEIEEGQKNVISHNNGETNSRKTGKTRYLHIGGILNYKCSTNRWRWLEKPA